MRLAVGSMFRDSGSYIRQTLFEQFDGLGQLLKDRGDEVVFLTVENDSTDDTAYQLKEFAACGHWPVHLIERSDGCPHHPSVDRGDRWRHLAWVANAALEELDEVEADQFLYVESDLAWDPRDLLRLVDESQHVAVSACNVMADGRWYDTWGTRRDGLWFYATPPFHPDLTMPENVSGGLFRVDSACGATALPAEVARKTRFQPEDCYVGWCRQIREHLDLYLDTEVKVVHR